MTGNDPVGSLTHTRQVMGTLNYMAPEQRERPTEVDHRADIYSLGVVIYEMLTGELPIGRFLPPSEKSALDQKLDEVVMRALEKEPNLRYQQASEFKTGFASAGNHFQPMANPVQPVKSNVGSRNRGHRLILSLLSGNGRKGEWTPGAPQWVVTVIGSSTIDLSQVLESEITLNMFTLMGGAEVIVAPDAKVDVDGLVLLGATDENVKQTPGPKRQAIRIRSWGAMGGCEIRTVSPPAPLKSAPTSMEHYRSPVGEATGIRGFLVMGYKLFATLTGIVAVMLFLASVFRVLDGDEGRMAAMIVGISCGMFWAGLGYFRRLIGAGPDSSEEETVKAYYSSSIFGTLIRCFAMFCGFACPILFVVASFEGRDDELRFTAIACGVACVALYTAASYLEEFLYGKLRE